MRSQNNMAWKRKRTSRRALGICKRNKHEILETKDVRDQAERRLQSDFRDWAKLHGDLLQNVIEKLPLPDCFALTSVCKPWGSVATNYLDGCDRKVPCFVKRGDNEVVLRNSFNVLENSNFEMELPEAYGKIIFGCFKEWLFIAGWDKPVLYISLLNPFSGENITLPGTSQGYYLMVLSAAPNDENCICLIVRQTGFAFWTPGATQWHEIVLWPPKILDALFYGGCFYLLNENNGIVVIDEKNIISMLNNENGASIYSDYFPHLTLSVKLPNYPKSNCYRHYLVESCGKIVLVSRFFFKNVAGISETYAFETYKLDLQKLAWLKLENLENQILFVGSCCSRSYRTTDLGDAFSGKVYFINDAHCVHFNEWGIFYGHPEINDSDHWGVFCTLKPNHWPSIFRAKARQWAGVWLTAPISWYLKMKRR